MNLKEALTSTIQATENPLAPFILQDVHNDLARLGKLLTPLGNLDRVNEIADMLLSKWDEEAQNKISSDPNFLIALAGMLSEAVVSFTRSVQK